MKNVFLLLLNLLIVNMFLFAEDLKTNEKLNILLINYINQHNLVSVKAMLKNGADPNFLDKNGKTPIFYAIDSVEPGLYFNTDLEILKYLLEKGFSKNSPKIYGYSILFYFIDNYSIWNAPIYNDVQKQLISNGLKGKDRQKVLNIIKLMVEKGANINFTSPDYNESILFTAINTHDPYLIDYLLKHGADPNIVTYDGYTALSLTEEYISIYKEKYQIKIRKEYEKIKEILLKYGAQ